MRHSLYSGFVAALLLGGYAFAGHNQQYAPVLYDNLLIIVPYGDISHTDGSALNDSTTQTGNSTDSSGTTEGGDEGSGNEHNGSHEGDDEDGTESGGSTGGGNGSNTDGGNTGGGNTGGGTGTSKSYMLTAWNDLGMHCMDGNDFSVWSILPPYNTLHAQLKDKNGGLVTTGVTLTYEATTGTDGKINSSSGDKINFWRYSNKLFPGSNLQPDVGLAGKKAPGTTPETLTFNAQHQWWEAEGIPLTPYNDDGSKNYYPLVKVTAKDSNGNVLATAKVVLPVSDEMDCKRCHASSSLAPKAKPSTGWVNDADPEKDFKYNVLRLHDERMPTAVSDHLAEL